MRSEMAEALSNPTTIDAFLNRHKYLGTLGYQEGARGNVRTHRGKRRP